MYNCLVSSLTNLLFLHSPHTGVSIAVSQTSATPTDSPTGSPTSDTSSDSNSTILTIVIAAIAGFLGLIVLVLVIVIVIVACQRCKQSQLVIHENGPTSVTVAPVKEDGDIPPPVPVRTISTSGKHSSMQGSGMHHEAIRSDNNMPDLIQSQNINRHHNHLPQPQPHYDQAETRFNSGSFPYSDDNPRVIPPQQQKPPQQGRKKTRGGTYYDTVNLLHADNKLPGASGFSLSNVPSPHDVLSGSLNRQDNPPDFSYPIYNDGFTHDDLATYDTVDQDYDQIYSEPIEPEMLSVGEGVLIPSDALPYSAIYDDPHPLSQKDAPLEVVPANIIEIKKLGTGQFGQVILARTKNLSLVDMKLSETNSDRSHSILVAVKKLKDNAETGLFEAFEKEVKFMSRLNHDNVVKLLCVCRTGENFIMMEYMENGDLNQFLQKHALVPDTVDGLGEWEITPIILLYIGVQIASGLHYLSSRRFVHRDLATRNCLVGRDFIVKISDFGMSRKLYESAYYRVQGTLVLPIRWMACETFYGKFSVKSDAWAFGVALWELYTLAKCDPYDDMTDEEVIQDAIRGPNRKLLPRPEACPLEVYDVMLRCWVNEPAMRADFGEIYSRLYMCYTSQASL